jgi:hypothetical protein
LKCCRKCKPRLWFQFPTNFKVKMCAFNN